MPKLSVKKEDEKKAAGKFLVKCGFHHEGGKSYQQGEVVESAKDLAAWDPDKFERVHEYQTQAPESPSDDEGTKPGDSDTPET